MQTQPALIYENEVLELLDDIIDVPARPVILLEDGHYNPVTGADKFSIVTLRAALGVGEHLIEHFGKRLRLVFGILVDNLGTQALNVAGQSIDTLLPGELSDIV
jgi:hypothetical protein